MNENLNIKNIIKSDAKGTCALTIVCVRMLSRVPEEIKDKIEHRKIDLTATFNF
jgi:hypothetical protein